MMTVDMEGFEEAMKIAKSYGRVKPEEEDGIRRAFYVRLALCEMHGGADGLCKRLLDMAAEISKEKALEDIGRLECDEADKEKMRKML